MKPIPIHRRLFHLHHGRQSKTQHQVGIFANHPLHQEPPHFPQQLRAGDNRPRVRQMIRNRVGIKVGPCHSLQCLVLLRGELLQGQKVRLARDQ